MRSLIVSLLLFIAVPMFSPPARAEPDTGSVRNIGKSDPLRKPLLDALRGPVEKDLGQPVQFVVSLLRVQDTWAFVIATPQTKTGQPIDYARTHYAQAIADGVFDGGTVFALLQSEAGAWSVKEFVIGPTDVAFLAWPEQHGAPASLFELPFD
ncbi:hypothetical protein [Tahibacter sp.]|uniref:hypothetical protein n=1 Tax=Tahibacter sp. TaxID=2056211 RepID=UPI0028C45310|nr:hypothetical protein [Tahibacter sp.]